MKHITLIAVISAIVVGGWVLTNQYQENGAMRSGDNGQGSGSGIADTLESAKQAAEQLEDGAQMVDEAEDADAMDDSEEETVDVQEEGDTMQPTSGQVAPSHTTATMLVAGGCFWCVEADLEKLSGVIDVVSGYAGGDSSNPTYENYDESGHREVVKVTYNPQVVSFEEILIYAMKHMDPTDDHGSFYDRGDEYAPAFYYKSAAEKQIIQDLIREVDEQGPYDDPLAIDVEPDATFWPAEDYHQDYYKGTLSQLKYKYYRNASGRDDFIENYWGDDTGPTLPWRTPTGDSADAFWKQFQKPSDSDLRAQLTSEQYRITQEEETESSFQNEYWNNHEEGIYVDVVSGEPLFSSTHKFDSGTGWPSFTRPIDYSFVTEHADYKLIVPRTEIRSAIADSHLGHVFNDAPKELGGVRYCMNSAALRFIPRNEMEEKGYGSFLYLFE